MSVPGTLRWIGLALLGIAVAAAVAIAASNLASQQIGLASESISAGDALAPATGVHHDHGPQRTAHGQGDRNPEPTTTIEPTMPTPPPEEPAPTTTVETPRHEDGDDHSSGHGADD
jgi:hypothetical protein